MKNQFIKAFIFLNLIAACAIGQTFDWAFKSVKRGGSSLGGITLDNSRNIIITGSMRYGHDFDPGPGVFNLTPTIDSTNEDCFIAKYDSAGNFINAILIGGKWYDYGIIVKVDQNNNIIVAGHFADTVDFDPGTGVEILAADFAGYPFILKLDSNLNFVWAKSFIRYYPLLQICSQLKVAR